jgi:predicted MFS family arabinose efflux permease
LGNDRRQLRHALFATSLVQVLVTGFALALTPIAPRAALDFGVDAHLIGFQISLIYFAGAFGSAAAGTLLHRYGAIRVEQLALGLLSVGICLLATANLTAAVFASLLMGISNGIQNPASAQILGRVSPPHRRNVVFSVKQAGVPVGAALASVGFPLLDASIGWRAGFVLVAIGPLLLMGHLGRSYDRELRSDLAARTFVRGLLEDQRLVWRRAEIRVLALLGLVYSAAQLSLSAFAVLLLVEEGGWSLIAAAGVAGVMQLSGAIGRVFWGWLADRTGSGFAILAFIGLGSTTGMLVLPWIGDMAAAAQVAVFCMMGLCLSGWNGVMIAEVAHHSEPSMAGRAVGGALVYVFLGVTIGPSSFALAFERIGQYGMTFAVIGAATAAGCLAATAMAARRSALAKKPGA